MGLPEDSDDIERHRARTGEGGSSDGDTQPDAPAPTADTEAAPVATEGHTSRT